MNRIDNRVLGTALLSMAAAGATAAIAGGTPAADKPEPAAEPVKDIFDGLPTIKLGEATGIVDTSSLECSGARKYSKVHESAVGAKMPIMSNWKHGSAIFVSGNVTKESRAGSVFHTVQDLVKRAGRQGIASYELATLLRKAQIGNKRSHYCEKLPPVGWAEGYINSAVQQGLINVHATRRAPALVVAAAEAAGDKAEGAKTGTNG